MKYDIIFWDLDGTVIDSGLGVTNSIMYALDKMGIEVPDRTQLYKFIGPPLNQSFKMFYNLSDEDIKKAIGYYRENYKEKGILENTVYEGVPEVIKKLKEMGKKIVLATSKPEDYAKKILQHIGVYDYFDFVAGASMDGVRNDKEQVIEYALESIGVTDTKNVLMVGDRKYDIEGAGKFGIDVAAVLYGYGNREEFIEFGATYIVEKPEEIIGICEGLN